ncbi:BCL-6 corepressor-like protein 1 isoform X3 [Poeciliopsis prolifica]|uniref:BCL-6 corepressor-like protein 1 isoform X3 n=1 Tax=Poeciliopsis prolifica TaxID=188132 RepID=UPI0024130FF7|nr:BCL-6 corepressor-like protein 1 isoform X3 [Poeciliopsis prolifica]
MAPPKRTSSFMQCHGNERLGIHSNTADNCSYNSRMLAIEKVQYADTVALFERIEKLCDSVTARNNAVLRRLGRSIRQKPSPSLQVLAFQSKSSECPQRQVSVKKTCHIPPINGKRISCPNKALDEPFLDIKLLLGSQQVALACGGTETKGRTGKPSANALVVSVDSLSTMDSHIPRELTSISLSPYLSLTLPPLPPALANGASGIPVKIKQAEPDQKVSRRKQHSVSAKVDQAIKRQNQFLLIHQLPSKSSDAPLTRMPPPLKAPPLQTVAPLNVAPLLDAALPKAAPPLFDAPLHKAAPPLKVPTLQTAAPFSTAAPLLKVAPLPKAAPPLPKAAPPLSKVSAPPKVTPPPTAAPPPTPASNRRHKRTAIYLQRYCR